MALLQASTWAARPWAQPRIEQCSVPDRARALCRLAEWFKLSNVDNRVLHLLNDI